MILTGEEGMKCQNMKSRIISAIRAFYRPAVSGLLVVAFAIGLFGNHPLNAASDRAKKIAAIIGVGGAGGGIAAIAGSAKWFPLGFGVGGLAGGLIARHIIKKRRERRKNMAPYESKRKQRGSRRVIDGEGQPAMASRRHIRMK